jgi:cytochrome c
MLEFSCKLLFSLLIITFITSCNEPKKRILVFSKTLEFRHESIEPGISAIQKMGKENGFLVDTTENADYFTEAVLKNYAAIVFLNTTGDVLNHEQQAFFERYIQAGGGFVGVHSAADTEYDWPWYNKLAGAYFKSHPEIQNAKLNVLDKNHPSTKMLEDIWNKKEEWYDFKKINAEVNVLIEVDTTSYEGGDHGGQHPMAWYHNYDGGRAFYTGIGHMSESFEETLFLQHLLGGIQYAMGDNNLDYSKARTLIVPEENRFVKDVLDFNLNEPMEMDEIPGKGILFIERRGVLKFYDFEKSTTSKIARLDVFYGNEDGLLGLAIDPNYSDNNWIYLFYSAPGEVSKQHISRFDLVANDLDLASEKILITIPTERECCHSGGGLEFDKEGNLFIGVGDNTNPFESDGFAPIDEQPGRALWDAQRSASNTNDFRGKILRITPQPDGTYTIPEGNLFPEGTKNTRPEIYAMGLRNPFRFSIDSQTGFLYWGDVGPDAGAADSERGPEGMGEFNQARESGYWGWPYSRGNNQAYNDYDFYTQQPGPKFDLNNIINDSPNNTGLKKLPQVQPSMVWYSYDTSPEFPWLEEGGVNPMAGPVFHTVNLPGTKEGFPDYYENKLFLYEWMRDRIYVVTLDNNHQYLSAAPFMPNTEFSHPMDMLFGSDGHMYLLEYGQKWNIQNLDACLNRIRFLRGNRPPVARITADTTIGATPLTVQFSASKSKDYDQDELSYEWFFTGTEVQSNETNPRFTFEVTGFYDVKLKVTDPAGESVTTSKKILVGNSPPKLTIQLDTEDRIYKTNNTINYKVTVVDKEDGSTENQSIDHDKVKVTLSFLPEGEDLIAAAIGHQQSNTPKGQLLIDGSDCSACHAIGEKVNGPSFIDIAKKYSNADKDYLTSSIIKGSSGIWGETMMTAHPQLSVEDVQTIVNYILSLDPDQKINSKTLPLTGSFEFKEHLESEKAGKYILMASYLDNGNPEQDEMTLSAQEQITFIPPKIEAEKADELADELGIWELNDATLVGSIVHNSYLKFNNISLKDVESIKLAAAYASGYKYKGIVEVREASTTGRLIGEAAVGYFHEEEEGVETYQIPIQSSLDKGDLFLVFKNLEDKHQFVMNADWIILNYTK